MGRVQKREKMNLKFGIPCSKIKDKIQDVEINCTSESEAMGIACGCILADKYPEVYMQDSGMLNCLDIILSLYKPYFIPLPKMLLSLRKKPFHHSFTGKITKDLLKLIDYDGEIEIVEQND